MNLRRPGVIATTFGLVTTANDVSPFLRPRALDLNAGNAQVAHGIVLVLRPLDL